MFAAARSLASAAPTDASSALGDVLPWLIALLAFLCVGAVLIALARRYVRSDASSGGGGFTLHDLRQLHARGELSDEEFTRAREQLIGHFRGASDEASDASKSPRETGNDGADAG